MTRTEQQLDAIRTRERAVCVDAGAGSGKTSVLVERIVSLLEERRAGLDEIVAITFTENAAAEMKLRLRAAFRERAPRDNPEEMSYWRELERRIEGARVSTIHSFCSSLLRENALRLGMDPDFAVLADADAQLLLRDTVRGAVHALLDAGDENALRVAVEWPMRDLVALLISLQGKRAVIGRLVADQPRTDISEICRIWAARAARERDRRLAALPALPALRRYMRLLESYAGQCEDETEGRELKRRAYVGALHDIAAAQTTAQVDQALNRLLTFNGPRASYKKWVSREVYDALDKVLRKVKDFAADYMPATPDPEVEADAAELTCALLHVHEAVAAACAEAKAAVNGLDFEDLILQAHAMLRDHAEVRERTARGIRYLLMDEFQDTDNVQLEIARLLHDTPDGPDLFIVGDAKQSIYLFRGAEVEVFDKQQRDSKRVIALGRNFRTVPDVLEFVNTIFAETGLLASARAYAPMQADRVPVGEPRIEFLLPPEDADASVEAYRRAEAELIAGRMLELARDTDFRDMAILLRSTSALYLYEDALRRAQIPYLIIAGAGFYERQEVLDILNLFRVVLDPWDEEALFGFLRSPVAGLSDEDLLRLRGRQPLCAAFAGGGEDVGQPGAARLRRARALITEFRALQHAGRPLPEFMRHVLVSTGLEAILLRQHHGLQRAANVRKLVALADDFTRLRPPTFRAFAEYLGEVRGEAVREGEAAMQPEGAGAVTIMTIHKSKGLEFPVVFLPDVSQKLRGGRRTELPLHRALGFCAAATGPDGERGKPVLGEAIRRRAEEEELAEHARLLYVAMTRARDRLILSGAPKPTRNSWLEALDDVCGIVSRPEGSVITGPGWSAIVRRVVSRGAGQGRIAATVAVPPRAAMERRIAPVALPASTRRTFSVSAVLDAMKGAIEEEPAPRRGPAAPAAVDPRVRGTLVHRMFELWDFAQNAPPDFNALLQEAGLPFSARDTMRADLERMAERFAAAPLAAVMAAHAELRREVPFYLRMGDAIVAGKIDACLGGDLLVDYKTGCVRDAGQARYEWQLLLYAAAIRRLTGATPVRGVLWYVDAEHAHEVDLDPAHVDQAERQAREVVERLCAAPPVPADEATHTADL